MGDDHPPLLSFSSPSSYKRTAFQVVHSLLYTRLLRFDARPIRIVGFILSADIRPIFNRPSTTLTTITTHLQAQLEPPRLTNGLFGTTL